MKKTNLLYIFVFFIVISPIRGQDCTIDKTLKNEIKRIVTHPDLKEDDFYKINELLYSYHPQSELAELKYCSYYTENIKALFEDANPVRRLVAYRLIGVAQDPDFNDKLLERINSDESSLLKTSSSLALILNKSSDASDDLFRLFASFPEGLPVNILVGMYVENNPEAVRKTSWKFVNSSDRNQQVLAIQCLAGLGDDETLQKHLLTFLENWEVNYKGYVIYAISLQKMENLKPQLEKYADDVNLKHVIIAALEASPTKADNEFAEQLQNRK